MQLLKIVILYILLAGQIANAEALDTFGYYENSAEDTLRAIIKAYQAAVPQVQGDAFVRGSLNFNVGAAEYNRFWTRRLQDDFDMPPEYEELMAKGRELWEITFANGKTMADCFANGGKGAAAEYPKVDAVSGKVQTFEWALNQCRIKNGASPLDYRDMPTMGALSVVARKLSDGVRIRLRVRSTAEQAAFARGKAIFYERLGVFEQACAHCHIQLVGKFARTEAFSPAIGQAAHFPVFRANAETGDLRVVTLQKRYEGCFSSIYVPGEMLLRPGSDGANDLEYFHTFLSNGLPLTSGVFRK